MAARPVAVEDSDIESPGQAFSLERPVAKSGSDTPLPDQDYVPDLCRKLERMTLRVEEAERALKEERRRRDRASVASMGGDASGMGRAFAKPKPAQPVIFDGSYSVLVNVGNWLQACERYLDQCRVDPEDWTEMASTFLSPKVMTWFTVTFKGRHGIPWEEFQITIRTRYLPQYHAAKLEELLDGMTQLHSISQYVDQFQVVEEALLLAKVTISQPRMRNRFITGLKNKEDKLNLFEQTQKGDNMNLVYQAALTLHECHMEATTWIGPSGTSKLGQHRPEGAAEKGNKALKMPFLKAHNTGKGKIQPGQGCFQCGSREHYVRQCPQAKEEWAGAFTRAVRAQIRKKCH